MDRGIFGGIPIVGGTDDLDHLHKRYIHKDVWDGLDFIESGSLLDELDVLGDDGGVGEEISSVVGHFWSREKVEKLDKLFWFAILFCFSFGLWFGIVSSRRLEPMIMYCTILHAFGRRSMDFFESFFDC